MPIIYRKTAKGVAEIETRAHKLPPRPRGLLILIDGKRDSSALGALAPQQVEATLAALLSEGFIEVVGESATAPTETGALPRPGPAKPAPDFDAQRRAAVRAVTDALGPAAETVAIKMENARSPEEMQAPLMQAAQLLANMRGRAAAEAFAARFLTGYPPN